MLRIRKEEFKRMEIVFPDLRHREVKFGGGAWKRCSSVNASDYYMVDEYLYERYLNKCKYYFKMETYIDGEWVRVDGMDNVLSEKDIKYFDKCIERNSQPR